MCSERKVSAHSLSRHPPPLLFSLSLSVYLTPTHLYLFLVHLSSLVLSLSITRSLNSNPSVNAFYDDSAGEDNFPQYAAEIRGLAAGVGMSYEDMFLHNLSFDIQFGHLPAGVPPDIDPLTLSQLKERCSTVLLNRPEVKVIGHNEDSMACLHQYAYMVSAVVDDPEFPSTLQGISDDDNQSKGKRYITFCGFCASFRSRRIESQV